MSNQSYNEYHKKYYEESPNVVKNAQYNYWKRKAIEKYKRENVTEEEIRKVRNEYHRNYRKKNPDVIKKNINDFWERKEKEKKDED